MQEISFVERITNNKESFSKAEKEISSYLLSHINEFSLLTIQELGEKTGSSEATIIRFAKHLGYSGYQELKNELKAYISDKFSPSKRMECYYKNNDVNSYDSFIDQQISYIENLKNYDFSKIAKDLLNAKRIYLYSPGGASMAPTETFSFWMKRYGLKIIPTVDSGHRLFDELVFADKDDLLFAFNFGKENPNLLKVLEYCNSNSIKSILITDFLLGASAKYATETIEVKRGPLEFFHSMSIPVLFLECLALEIAKTNDDVFRNMKKLEDTRGLFGI